MKRRKRESSNHGGTTTTGAAASTSTREEGDSWIKSVLQPGKALYEGHGTARPSVFVSAGPGFVAELQQVMDDHGGPGSWTWKKLPKKPVQGLARAPGGRMAELMAERRAQAAAREEQARERGKKAKGRQRLLDVRNEFLAELRQGTEGKGDGRVGAAAGVEEGGRKRRRGPGNNERGREQRASQRQQQESGASALVGEPCDAAVNLASVREAALEAYRSLKRAQQQQQQQKQKQKQQLTQKQQQQQRRQPQAVSGRAYE